MFKSAGLAKMFAGRMFVSSALVRPRCYWYLHGIEPFEISLGVGSGSS